MRKIYVDFDGTIVNSIKAITDLYNEDFQYYEDYKYINWVDIETWGFDECNCATPEYINTYFNQQRFFDIAEYMDNAKEVLERLKDEYEIIVASFGNLPNLVAKEKWIKTHMPYAEFVGVDMKMFPDKSHINMNNGVFIDDCTKNLITSNAQYKICFGDYYQWNNTWNGDRCFNWCDVEKYIKMKVGD